MPESLSTRNFKRFQVFYVPFSEFYKIYEAARHALNFLFKLLLPWLSSLTFLKFRYSFLLFIPLLVTGKGDVHASNQSPKPFSFPELRSFWSEPKRIMDVGTRLGRNIGNFHRFDLGMRTLRYKPDVEA